MGDSAQDWIKVYEAAESSLRQVNSEFRAAKKGGSKGAREKSRLAKKVKQAKDDIDRLEKELSVLERKGRIGEGEHSRRRGMMSDLVTLYEDVNDVLSGAQRRNELYEQAANREETEETKDMDNNQILQAQQHAIHRQDQQLDGILDGVTKLKEMSYDINNELTLHDHLLTELDSAVEATDGRIVRNTARIDEIEQRSGGWCPIIIMVLLLALIVLLLATNWACHIFNSDKC
jgi:chromosome segregation ATPase